ncbi:MAG TPA: SAM-dependent methyltransferase [Trebonia sp.]|jgi:SAM-dependent methyltransferase
MLDTAAPSLARAWDHLLGGGANFAADRSLAQRLEALHPGIRESLFSSRTYAAGAVTRIARSGVDQYLDLGAGLPTRPSTHETARAILPGARVAYVDRDPAVTEHGRALVPAGVRYVPGELAEPEAILTSGDLAGFIDFARPVCLVLTLALQVLDPGTARAVVGVLVRALAPGSYLVVTAGAAGLPESVWPGGFTAADLASFFAGLDLVPPGIEEGTVVRATGVKPGTAR